MDDSKRRGAVVHWLRNVGDPWIKSEHPPSAGSALSADDTFRPAVSEHARFGIATAVDHLGLVVDVMQTHVTFRHYGPLTTLRTALMASARTVWLLKPANRTERRFRACRIQLTNLIEQQKAIAELTGNQMSAELVEGRDNAVAQLEDAIRDLRDHALNLRPGKPLPGVPGIASLLQMLVEPHTYEGQGIRHLWRTGSAAAHGYHWANVGDGIFDEKAFDMSLYGSMIMVKDALELYEQRATNHLGGE